MYLTGNAETNLLKSELVRRVRLHKLAEIYVLMMASEISVYRDTKPDIFSPNGCTVSTLSKPAFFTSREVKQMGMEAIKISGSQMTGVLLAPAGAFLTYNGLGKMDYRAEQRAKALLTGTICYERLSQQYRESQIMGLLVGNSLDLFTQVLTAKDVNARCFFLLDGSFEHFYFLTNDHYGEVLLKLLSSSGKRRSLDNILSQGLQPNEPGLSIVNDAIDPDGNPVLFAYLMDMPRINRFCNGLQLHRKKGTLICFDFQGEVLRSVLGSNISIQAISFDKFERSFFNPKK